MMVVEMCVQPDLRQAGRGGDDGRDVCTARSSVSRRVGVGDGIDVPTDRSPVTRRVGVDDGDKCVQPDLR